MPQAITLLLRSSGLLEPLAKIWETLERNSIFYSWNLLLLANETNVTASPFFTDATNGSRRYRQQQMQDEKQAVMHALDQFVLSQHRSMKVLYGGTVSFLEGHIQQLLLEGEKPAQPRSNVSIASLQMQKRQRLAHFHAENLLRMQQQHQKILDEGGQAAAEASNNRSIPSPAAPGRKHLGRERGGRRSLLQMDNSIKTYSSIISATKEYSMLSVGKTSVTDSWLEGPLQWPPR